MSTLGISSVGSIKKLDRQKILQRIRAHWTGTIKTPVGLKTDLEGRMELAALNAGCAPRERAYLNTASAALNPQGSGSMAGMTDQYSASRTIGAVTGSQANLQSCQP